MTINVSLFEKLTASRKALFQTLNALSEGAWETVVYAAEGNQPWTVSDMARHLMSAERSMTRLMVAIQQGGEGASSDFDLERFNRRMVEKNKEKNPAQLLQEMSLNRQELLNFMNNLQPVDWLKKGRHGSMRIMSIEQICHLIADHERIHLEEIRQAIG